MNNSTPTPKKITLEDIAQRKKEVLQEICDHPPNFRPPCTCRLRW